MTIGIVVGAMVSIDIPPKLDSGGVSMMLAGMLGGAFVGAILLLAIALVYNSSIARDSARRGRRQVSPDLTGSAPYRFRNAGAGRF